MRLMGNKEFMVETGGIMVHRHYTQPAVKQLNEEKANANTVDYCNKDGRWIGDVEISKHFYHRGGTVRLLHQCG